MSLLVIGTLAFDSVETPYARRDDALGGSATFFAMSARFFSAVRLVGVVGQDFPDAVLADMRQRGIDTAGVEVAPGKSFRWAGRYEKDWNTRHTLATHLNVLEHFDPKIPERYRDTRYVFLANTAPAIQAKALDQLPKAEFVVLDTMNLWIDIARADLLAVLKRVDGIVLNDEEARLLTGESHLLTAAKAVLKLGPKFVVLKKGEHGAFLIGEGARFALPAYPVDRVVDPTGAGDSFAGGFMGYLAAVQNTHPATLRRAMVYGTVTASYCVESFSTDALAAVGRSQLELRFNEMHDLIRV
jgi:sugar/nucleoside kinase (ribokinase family)